jgi:signal transduction histidine kinase
VSTGTEVPPGVICTFHDITASVGAQRELARSNHDLEQFAFVASHDLKSPLRAIDSLAEWLTEDLAPALSETSAEHLRLLRQRAQRMEHLLDDLLAYSRAGRRGHEVRTVDVAALIARVVELIATPATFVVEARPPLPTFVTDEGSLQQVLQNLIANAVKHHDGGAGRITFEARDAGEFHEFIVTDDGPGIDPAHGERIFEMFHTLRPRDQVEGSGIGLAVVRRVVDRYHGRVWVEPSSLTPGRGAAFHVRWPKTLQPQLPA